MFSKYNGMLRKVLRKQIFEATLTSKRPIRVGGYGIAVAKGLNPIVRRNKIYVKFFSSLRLENDLADGAKIRRGYKSRFCATISETATLPE